MSNIYKSILYNLRENDNVRVIDYNEVISQKIDKIRSELEKNSQEYNEDGFTLGLNPAAVGELLDDQAESAVSLESAEETAEQIIKNAKDEAERLLKKAQEDAASVMKRAEQERIEIMQSASEEGFQKGYKDGTEEGLAGVRQKEEELYAWKAQAEADLQKERQEMEPKLVGVILDVFSEMTHLLAENKKDLILTVVNSTLEEIEVSKNYIIKVCPEEADFLKENKQKIAKGLADVNVEIVEDSFMKRGQCMIDTDIGVFDCSLDMQLEELIEDIRILSCSGK